MAYVLAYMGYRHEVRHGHASFRWVQFSPPSPQTPVFAIPLSARIFILAANRRLTWEHIAFMAAQVHGARIGIQLSLKYRHKHLGLARKGQADGSSMEQGSPEPRPNKTESSEGEKGEPVSATSAQSTDILPVPVLNKSDQRVL